VGLSRRLQADLCILGLSAVWGCTFVVSKRALSDISPLLFIAFRFIVATVVLLPFLPRASLRNRGPRGPLAAGLVIGVILFAGFVFQTVGLQHTTPARSAFITALYVVFTPLMAVLLGWKRPSIDSIAGAVVAFAGLHLLTDPESGGLGLGEALTVLCAVSFAAHLLAIDHYTRRHDPGTVAIVQIAAVALLSIVPAATMEQTRFVPTRSLLVALIVTSIPATAIAIYLLNRVQSWTTPTRAAIVFAAEPVFAALTSWAMEGEVLSGASLLGAVLILMGILTAEIGPWRRFRAAAAPDPVP
jgi:drug/metabolite transporter (DMT)-like permease